MQETHEQLKLAIAAIQAQRNVLGEIATETALRALQRRLTALETTQLTALVTRKSDEPQIDEQSLYASFAELHEISLSPGDILCRQGDASDGCYFLKTGRLGIYWDDEAQSLYYLTDVLPGNLVGELGAVTRLPRTATVKAESAATVIHVTAHDFCQLLGQLPPLVANILYLMRDRLEEADMARVSLGRSYEQALDRAQSLRTRTEQLAELLRLREELADMVVHDLRNPLGAVITSLDIFQEINLYQDDFSYDILRSMRRSAERMQGLVDTLLDIARLEQGEQILQRAPLELPPLAIYLLSELQPLAEMQGVTLQHTLNEPLPLVLADARILERVIVNLLDNALKFTPAQGHVYLEAHPDDTGARLRISIVDSGPGIPVAERTRIFEKFTQLPGTLRQRRGVGLGLTFCRMAIEAHGEHIWIEDGPEGLGNRVNFTLPLAFESPPA